MATNPDPIAEAHPSSRPVQPEHPMILDGGIVSGDSALMATCMVEELLMMGLAPDQLRAMTRSAEYQALDAARRALGDHAMDALVDDAIRRIGWVHHRTTEHHGDVQPVTLTVGHT